jgi:hypothetical protein
MNLPPDLCHLPKNTFIVGLTPGPSAPDYTTISHILAPLAQVLNEFYIGKQLPTYKHPQGITVRVKVVPIIADLQAIRKVTGFLGHSASLFCSFCHCRKADVDSLDDWPKRTNEEVIAAVNEWKACATKTGRASIASKYGVRWTPLHDLSYWRPADQLVLGFMHNTLEGILEYHLRDLFGIGRTAGETKRLGEASAEEDDTFNPEEYSDIDSELEDLLRESTGRPFEIAHFQAWRSSQTPEHQPPPSDISDGDETIRDAFEDIAMDIEDDLDAEYPPFETAFDFSAEQLALIRACIASIYLPTHVNRPPGNLGEAGHGSLKANELLILFSIIFPIILPELWYSDGKPVGRAEQLLLENLYHLVASTNIVASFTTSNSEADTYKMHYLEYRRSVGTIFSNYIAKPNHHYAMHNDHLLKYWGPLAALSEFPGERLLGMFQNIKTNKHMSTLSLSVTDCC